MTLDKCVFPALPFAMNTYVDRTHTASYNAEQFAMYLDLFITGTVTLKVKSRKALIAVQFAR